jgi:hypothetical protein
MSVSGHRKAAYNKLLFLANTIRFHMHFPPVTRQPHSRDALSALFWAEAGQCEARANSRRTLYRSTATFGKEIPLISHGKDDRDREVAAVRAALGEDLFRDAWINCGRQGQQGSLGVLEQRATTRGRPYGRQSLVVKVSAPLPATSLFTPV